MSEFQLDMSGAVFDASSTFPDPRLLSWPDLSPFVQGYVEALFAAHRASCPDCGGRGEVGGWSGGVASVEGGGGYESEPCDCPVLGFSDLAPEALDRIRKDCAAILAQSPSAYSGDGRRFWRVRQDQPYGPWNDFPPLTVYLDDNGKVNLR